MDRSSVASYLSHKQRLNSLCDNSNRQVLAANGWARSVGGANGYLSLFARNRSSARTTESDGQKMEIAEFASARGCTYILPKEHFRVGIKVGQGFNDASTIRTAKSKLGVTDEEIAKLKEGILRSLQEGPAKIDVLKARLGDLVINFGEAGKKIGQTINLSLGLLSLQAEGKIHRVPQDNRFDTQTYSYQLFEDAPVVDDSYPKEEAFRDLAMLFWQWTGLASLAHFQWFSGLGVGAAKKAIEGLPLVSSSLENLLILESKLKEFQGFQTPLAPQIRLVSSLDGLFLLRRDLTFHLSPEDAEKLKIDSKKPTGLQELSSHAIVDRGKIIGLWEYEVSSQNIVFALTQPMTDQIQHEVRETEAMIRDELGDARAFSLDSPKSRQPMIDQLRAMSK